jgi:hypothetical protein
MSAHKDARSEEDLKTIAGLREENRWLKALIELQATRLRILEDMVGKQTQSANTSPPPPAE